MAQIVKPFDYSIAALIDPTSSSGETGIVMADEARWIPQNFGVITAITEVEEAFKAVISCITLGELQNQIFSFTCSIHNTAKMIEKRILETYDPLHKQEMISGMAILKCYSDMLLAVCESRLSHPDLEWSHSSMYFVRNQIVDAIKILNNAVRGVTTEPNMLQGALAHDFITIEQLLENAPDASQKGQEARLIVERVEDMITNVSTIAHEPETRDSGLPIIKLFTPLRHSIADLLEDEMALSSNVWSDRSIRAIEEIKSNTKSLRKELQRVAIDRILDAFVHAGETLADLNRAALEGDSMAVENRGMELSERCLKQIEAVNFACSLSNNGDGISKICEASRLAYKIYPEVLNAAKLLAIRPHSPAADTNMHAVDTGFEQHIEDLIEALYGIMEFKDTLTVIESHILENVHQCILAMQCRDYRKLERESSEIAQHAELFYNIVKSKMESHSVPCEYTENVLTEATKFRSITLAKFQKEMSEAVQMAKYFADIDDLAFRDLARLVFDGARDIRRAVIIRTPLEELDLVDLEYDTGIPIMVTEVIDEYPGVEGITTTREALREMRDADKRKLYGLAETFSKNKLKFDREMDKWDPSTNEIIAKIMLICGFLSQITESTRAKGPLKTTLSVAHAAGKIHGISDELEKLLREISEACPQCSTKYEIERELLDLTMYSKHLLITANKKLIVWVIDGMYAVGGVNDLMFLSATAGNLLETLRKIIYSTFEANQNYKQPENIGTDIVLWKMRMPMKTGLINLDHIKD